MNQGVSACPIDGTNPAQMDFHQNQQNLYMAIISGFIGPTASSEQLTDKGLMLKTSLLLMTIHYRDCCAASKAQFMLILCKKERLIRLTASMMPHTCANNNALLST